MTQAQRASPLRGTHLWLAGIGTALAALTVAGPGLHGRLGGWALIVVFAVGSLGALAATWLGETGDQKTALLIILMSALVMRLGLLTIEPTLSGDIYRYIWDGRVQAAGINPYRYVPAAEELASLRDAAIWPNINRASYAVTIYPPVAQAVFLAMTHVGENIVTMKAGLLLFEAAAVTALVTLLDRLGLPATRVAAYAWHPLPVWEIAGNGHVDAAMLAFLCVGLLAFARGSTLGGGLLVTLGALVKPMALVVLPVLWRPWNWRLPLLVAATLAVAYLPFASAGTGVLGFLPGYLREEGFISGDGYKLLWLIESFSGPLPHGVAVFVALSAILLVGLALAISFRPDRSLEASLQAARWLLVLFLILISPHYPWYFLILTPFLALAPSAAVWVLTSTCVLFYDVVPNDSLPAYEPRIAVFTLATLAALAYDLWCQWRRPVGVAVGGAT
jgi:hypothetical protein